MPSRIPTMSALLAAALVAVTVPVTLAQGASPAADVSLAARLPATVGGAPVEIVAGEDLGAWISALFAGEPHPEIDALETALAGQGLSPADVDTVTAWFGPEQDGQIMGFGIPGGDATPLADAITATYLIGVGDLQRTEREVGDRAVDRQRRDRPHHRGYRGAARGLGRPCAREHQDRSATTRRDRPGDLVRDHARDADLGQGTLRGRDDDGVPGHLGACRR
jgi:hypothetical protein